MIKCCRDYGDNRELPYQHPTRRIPAQDTSTQERFATLFFRNIFIPGRTHDQRDKARWTGIVRKRHVYGKKDRYQERDQDQTHPFCLSREKKMDVAEDEHEQQNRGSSARRLMHDEKAPEEEHRTNNEFEESGPR